MFKKLLLVLAMSSVGFCGSEDSSQSYDMPFISALKQAKGKDKEVHEIAGIDFIYCIVAKKCHRYNDLKRSFAKYGVNPYRFTSFSPSHINADTMHRTCLRGSRHFRRYTVNTLVVKKGKFVLSKRKMAKRKTGYIHQKMSLKALSRALSHISVIQDALKSGYENIWIMDSGTSLRCDPNILSSYVARANQEIPDWTSIYTDYSERDYEDNLEPIKHFFHRPDFEFLEPDDYLSRDFEDDEDVYYEDDSNVDENSPSYTVGRVKEQEKLACQKWDQNHPELENGGEGATGPSDQPGSNSAYEQGNRAGISLINQNQWAISANFDNPTNVEKFSHVGLLKGAHSYILNRKGMKLIMEWYLDHKIFIPYAQEIQIIPGMHPYYTPDPVTKNCNKG